MALGDDFLIFVLQIKYLAIATNQIKRFGQNSMFGRGLLKEHFCKTFVKISAVT